MFFAKSGLSDVFHSLSPSLYTLKVVDLEVVTSFRFISSSRHHRRT